LAAKFNGWTDLTACQFPGTLLAFTCTDLAEPARSTTAHV
jgi:hypothetical protein